MEEEKQNKGVINHFEANSNCQVFNGSISGCVFAMPGSNITQQTGGKQVTLNEKEQDIVSQLTPLFFGNENDAKDFLLSIQGIKPRQITEIVNRMVSERKISELSYHRDLYRILHNCGIYTCSESNWNQQVI